MSATADIVTAQVTGMAVPSQALSGSTVTVEAADGTQTHPAGADRRGRRLDHAGRQRAEGRRQGRRALDRGDAGDSGPGLRSAQQRPPQPPGRRRARRWPRGRRAPGRRLPGGGGGGSAGPAENAVSSLPAARRARRPVIEVQDVERVYRLGEDVEVRALDGVSLRIARGEFVAIMGSSGSGKSTLMHILGCLDAPTAGRYLLDGVDVRDIAEDDLADLRNRKIGFVFQSFNLVARTTRAGQRRAAARLRRPRRAASAGRARPRRWPPWAWRTACTTCPPSSRAASSSAPPWRGRSSPTRRSSWPTSRPATSTRTRPRRSSASSRGSTPRAARSSSSPTRATSPPARRASCASADGRVLSDEPTGAREEAA